LPNVVKFKSIIKTKNTCNNFSALNWLGGKSFEERTEGTLIESDFPVSNVGATTTTTATIGTPETLASTIVNTTYQPMRKYSTYVKNNTKIPKGARYFSLAFSILTFFSKYFHLGKFLILEHGS
jgi:hypothetical protein